MYELKITKRPARAKALIINAFALTGRIVFGGFLPQGGALGYVLLPLRCVLLRVLTPHILFLFVNLLQHFIHSSLQLSVVAVDEVLRSVVDCYVWVELCVLGVCSVKTHTSHLGNAKYN